jgi:ribosomal protein L37AE/L43A
MSKGITYKDVVEAVKEIKDSGWLEEQKKGEIKLGENLKCGRCKKRVKRLHEFCNGEYWFCDKCNESWYIAVYTKHGIGYDTWDEELFKQWLKRNGIEPFVFR